MHYTFSNNVSNESKSGQFRAFSQEYPHVPAWPETSFSAGTRFFLIFALIGKYVRPERE